MDENRTTELKWVTSSFYSYSYKIKPQNTLFNWKEFHMEQMNYYRKTLKKIICCTHDIQVVIIVSQYYSVLVNVPGNDEQN